jgi:hypothetical protein
MVHRTPTDEKIKATGLKAESLGIDEAAQKLQKAFSEAHRLILRTGAKEGVEVLEIPARSPRN